jgi:23S rRNA (uridine2552-2'-O)-methyltransferase
LARQHDRRGRHDAFFRKARSAGYAARSVYKLEEIDRRLRILRPGDRVLDLGCRPGSWLQYAAKVAGPHGLVVGLDRQPLAVGGVAGARVLVGDVFAITDAELLGDARAFDVVLSDMAPDTTGIRATDQARSLALFEEALARANRMLAPAGSFVGKIFQGPEVDRVRKLMATTFSDVRLVKPAGSRAESPEVYLVGKGFVPPDAAPS